MDSCIGEVGCVQETVDAVHIGSKVLRVESAVGPMAGMSGRILRLLRGRKAEPTIIIIWLDPSVSNKE
jgi:hypothetical protein